jgi:hypothetical protein
MVGKIVDDRVDGALDPYPMIMIEHTSVNVQLRQYQAADRNLVVISRQ